MLRRTKENIKIFDFGDTSDVILAKAEERLADKMHELEEAEYLYNLVEKDNMHIYRNEIQYYSVLNCMAQKAQKWLSCLENNCSPDDRTKKLDRRRSYPEKDSYNWLIKDLKKYLGIEDLALTNIYEYNFGEAWEYIFDYKDHTWSLTVPNVEKVKEKSYHSYGSYVYKIKLDFYTGANTYRTIYSTFDENTLAGQCDKYLEGLNEEA